MSHEKALHDKYRLINSYSFPDPYRDIAEFMSLWDVHGHRKYISGWMTAVNRNDFWRVSTPSELLFYCGRLLVLIKALRKLSIENKKRKTAIDLLKEKGHSAKTDLLHPALFMEGRPGESLWDEFPRNISLEEYNDPYLIVSEFFGWYSLDEWKRELYDLLFDALSRNAAARDIRQIEIRLQKLVEAAHLIYVREVKYIGEIKRKPAYTLDMPLDDQLLFQIFSKVRLF